MNTQILLNLARAAQGHPAYYLQMGPITSTFRFGGETGARIGSSPIINSLGDLEVMGLTQSLNLTEQPTFSFTPLSGPAFGQSLFKPIDIRIFVSLYNQGKPLNQLIRTMVRSVELQYENEDKLVVYNNNPLDSNEDSYVNFLRFAGGAKELQRKRAITISVDSANNSLSCNLTSEASGILAEYAKQNYASAGDQQDNEDGEFKLTLKIRTFNEVLTALASEHELFETRNNLDQDFSSKIPKSEQNPILRIDWSGEGSMALETPLVSTRYQGKMYKITDMKSHSGYSETSRRNREVFLLLSTLYTQLSLDPTTLPIQQLIQVN
jgi:hypothetical protein